jgi:hypothetical protein
MKYTRRLGHALMDFRPPAAYFDLKARAGVPVTSGNAILWRR